MIVAIGFTYHFQHLEFEGGKVGNSGSHLTGQGVVGCAVFVEIPGDLVQVAADFPVLRHKGRYGGEHFFAVGSHPDNRRNPAVKNGLPDILGLAHGEGGAFVLKGSALVLGQTGLDNTFPLGGVVGFVWHGGSTPFKLQRTIFI